jgi:hypothetical protein
MSPEEIYRLAFANKCDSIPAALITDEVLRTRFPQSSSGETGSILHCLAYYGKCGILKKEVNKLEHYLATDYNRLDVFEASVISKTKWKLPEGVMVPRSLNQVMGNLDNRTFFEHLLDDLDKPCFKKQILSPELLAQTGTDGQFHIHSIARRGWLKYLPKNIFTKDLVMLEDENKSNLLHYASRFEGINVLPKEFLTKENLSKQSKSGRTPIYWAVANGKFKGRIPEEELSPELLEIADSGGETAYHAATYNNTVEELSERLLTQRGLLLKDGAGISGLDFYLRSYYPQTNPSGLKKILRVLDEVTIKGILDKYKDRCVLNACKEELLKRQISKGNKGDKESNKGGKNNLIELEGFGQ